MLPTVFAEYRLIEDPSLKFTPSGKAVANFRVAANSRRKDEATGEWKDDKVCFLNAVAWAPFAEHVAESLQKGDLVLIEGRIETRSYENRDGEKRTSFDLSVNNIGPSLRWNDVSIQRADRSSGGAQRSTSRDDNDPWQTPDQDSTPPF